MHTYVAGANAAPTTSAPVHRRPDQVVQDVFSAVLAAAGREGYQSAEPPSDTQPDPDQVHVAWSQWFAAERIGGRYRTEPSATNLGAAYGEILVRAYKTEGYADPQAFLGSLSRTELQVVQQVHRLADPIDVSSLSEEGSLNLLIPPPAQVDANHDGLTRCGAAYGLRFPSSNTPPDVVAAWEETTADLEPVERMLYELQMTLPLLTANIVCDDRGRFLHRYEPGDPGFTNPMDSPTYSYRGAAQDRLRYLEQFRYQMTPQRYEQDKAFWEEMLQQLAQQGAR